VNLQTVYLSNLAFDYDPLGNRIYKIEKSREKNGGEMPSQNWMSTFYVRHPTIFQPAPVKKEKDKTPERDAPSNHIIG
jgi:hypothetical protein